ncbi:hypothetical protein EMCRGX_G002720 [Ephydatia muelleri]
MNPAAATKCEGSLKSKESLASDLANRLSKVADVPVAPDDGLSRFICRSCKHKLVSGECFRTTARASYEKNKDTLISTGSAMDSQVQVTNKRTKDTSGPGASPHTRQCRPVAKRLTPEHPGRRLTYPNCDNSMPLSDSCTECSTADGPSEQGIDVVGVSNLPHNPAEGRASSVTGTCQNSTINATADPTSVKISVYSRTKGAEVMINVSPEFEKVAKALAGGNLKSICRALFANPLLRQEAVSKVSSMVNSVAILLKERNIQMCGVQSYISSALFSTRIHKKAWTRLNHLNVTLSYNAILKRVDEISKEHTKVMDKWLSEGAFVKFVGDNVDKQFNVRDIRSDHHGQLRHMFSLLVIKACIPPPPPASLPELPTQSLTSANVDCFLPSLEDMKVVQRDMEVLVGRIMCDDIKDMIQLKKCRQPFCTPTVTRWQTSHLDLCSSLAKNAPGVERPINQNLPVFTERIAAGTPFFCNPDTWSAIRETSGEITSARYTSQWQLEANRVPTTSRQPVNTS